MEIEEREESDDDREEIEAPNDKKRGFIYPLRITNQELARHVNLLLTEEDGSYHYSTIKNFNGLMRAQYSKHHGEYFYCYSCLHGFTAKNDEKTREECVLLQDHVKYCKQQKSQRVSYPQKKAVEFTNIQKQLKQSFVGYADFECILKKETDADVHTGIAETSRKEFKYQSHKPASYFTKFVSIDPEFTLPSDDCFEFPQQETYIGEDSAENFLDYVQAVADKIFKKYIKHPKDMIYSDENKKVFENASSCHICSKPFKRLTLHCHREGETSCNLCVDQPDIIVRDHCHILGVSLYFQLYIVSRLHN